MDGHDHSLVHLPAGPNTSDLIVDEMTQVVIHRATPEVISRTRRRILTLQGISWAALLVLMLLFYDLRQNQRRQQENIDRAMESVHALQGRADERRVADEERSRDAEQRYSALWSVLDAQARAAQNGQAEIRSALDLMYGTRGRLDAVQDSLGRGLGSLNTSLRALQPTGAAPWAPGQGEPSAPVRISMWSNQWTRIGHTDLEGHYSRAESGVVHDLAIRSASSRLVLVAPRTLSPGEILAVDDAARRYRIWLAGVRPNPGKPVIDLGVAALDR
jgi:hypothetical protein